MVWTGAPWVVRGLCDAMLAAFDDSSVTIAIAALLRVRSQTARKDVIGQLDYQRHGGNPRIKTITTMHNVRITR